MNIISRKNIISFIGSITLVFLSLFCVTTVMARTTKFGTAHRGAWSTETLNVYYHGGVYFYPHYATHTKRGFAKYTRGGKTITKNKTSSVGNLGKYRKHYPKSEKIQVKIHCWDSFNPHAPKTRFYYKFK